MPYNALLQWKLVLGAALLSIGCQKASAEQLIDNESTIAERATNATFYWNIEKDGDARLVVKDSSGQVVKEGVTGQLTFAASAEAAAQATTDAKATTVSLAQEKKSGVLSADGPDLDAEVTQVKYAVLVDGKPWTGTLHVPNNGTQGLAEAAKQSGSAENDKGPNGGTIQVVGGHRYEVVADSGSGEVRVYLLDTDGKRPKKVRLGIDAKSPRVVELEAHDDGYYVVELEPKETPRKLTLVVVDVDDKSHAVVIGHHAGAVIVVDTHPKFWVHRGWKRGLARGHYKGTAAGPPGHSKSKVRAQPNKGKSKISIKVK